MRRIRHTMEYRDTVVVLEVYNKDKTTFG